MDPSSTGLDPGTTLLVALLGTVGVIVSPALVALINRGGKAKAAVEAPAPDIDLVALQDEENDRLAHEVARRDREVERLDSEVDRLTRENVRLREQLTRERLEHARALAQGEP